MNSSKKYWVSTNEVISVQTKTILNEYLLSLKLANKAESTISRYCSMLERFFSECTVPIHDLTSDDVLKWFQQYSIGKKEKTLDFVLSILFFIFQVLYRRRVFGYDCY